MARRYLCKTSWICLQDVLKTSWKHIEDVLKMLWRDLEDIFKTSWRRLGKTSRRHLENVLKTSWRCLENVLKTSWRHMAKTNILVLTKTSWRRLEDVFWRRKAKANIFFLIKTSWRRLLKTNTKDVFKACLRRLHQDKTNACWEERHLSEMDFHEGDHSIIRSSHSQMFFKIGALKNLAIFTGKHLCWSLFLIKYLAWRPSTQTWKTPTQVFSCEYCEIFESTFFYRTPLVAAFLLTHCFS